MHSSRFRSFKEHFCASLAFYGRAWCTHTQVHISSTSRYIERYAKATTAINSFLSLICKKWKLFQLRSKKKLLVLLKAIRRMYVCPSKITYCRIEQKNIICITSEQYVRNGSINIVIYRNLWLKIWHIHPQLHHKKNGA